MHRRLILSALITTTHGHRMTVQLTLRVLLTRYPSHLMTAYQLVQSFSIKFIISYFLLTLCDLVRTVSHDRGLGYSNRFLTLQSVCTLPTLWSSSSTQHPGTCPTGSLELVPQE